MGRSELKRMLLANEPERFIATVPREYEVQYIYFSCVSNIDVITGSHVSTTNSGNCAFELSCVLSHGYLLWQTHQDQCDHMRQMVRTTTLCLVTRWRNLFRTASLLKLGSTEVVCMGRLRTLSKGQRRLERSVSSRHQKRYTCSTQHSTAQPSV